LANPKPWTSPKVNATHARRSRPSPRDQVVGADEHDAERDRGSMIDGGRRHHVQGRQRQA
jgi:hypothetical protein